MAWRRGDYAASLEFLAGLKPTPLVLKLKQQALEQSGDWRGMLALVPELEKNDKADALMYEQRAACYGFDQAQAAILKDSAQKDAPTRLFKSLSRKAEACPEVILAYARALLSFPSLPAASGEDQAHHILEPLVRQAINKAWNPALVEVYGNLESAPAEIRMKTLQRWLLLHEGDAAVHYCAGCIYEQTGDRNLARQHYTKSVDLGGTGPIAASANGRLANIFTQEGDFVRSNEHLRLALAQVGRQG